MRPNSVEVWSSYCYKLELASSASAFHKTSKSWWGGEVGSEVFVANCSGSPLLGLICSWKPNESSQPEVLQTIFVGVAEEEDWSEQGGPCVRLFRRCLTTLSVLAVA